jgi:hypothetical protein
MAGVRKELAFRNFDELLNSVLVDLRVLEEEGMIEPAQLIKIAERVNYDLGLKINQTKETLIDVENYIAKLPEDFYTLNFAMLMGRYRDVSEVFWAGRVTENEDVVCSSVTGCLAPYETQRNTCTPDSDPFFQRRVYSICEGNRCVKVREHKNYEVKEYELFERLYIKPQKYLDPGSINSKCTAPHTAEIKNGFLYCSAECAKIYLSYQGALVDEDNNLLVLDHKDINLYYEAALKAKIFENLYYAGEEVKEKLEYAKQE